MMIEVFLPSESLRIGVLILIDCDAFHFSVYSIARAMRCGSCGVIFPVCSSYSPIWCSEKSVGCFDSGESGFLTSSANDRMACAAVRVKIGCPNASTASS